MNLSISPGKNNVGAYINGINLKSLDQDQAIEIKKILNKYGVIFIKEQNLDPETYQNFAKNIGQPVVYPRLKGCLLYTSPSPRDVSRSRMPSSA